MYVLLPFRIDIAKYGRSLEPSCCKKRQKSPNQTLIEFGYLLAKTSKMKKLDFLTKKYTKLCGLFGLLKFFWNSEQSFAPITLIEFGYLLAKTSKMKKLDFLTKKYTKLKLRH